MKEVHVSETGLARMGILLGCVGIIVVLTLAAGSCGYVIFRSIRSSDAYQMAVAELRRHPAAREALGEPIEEGLLTTGSVGVTGPSGEAKLAIPVSGPRGEGSLYVEAVKRAGEWEMTLLQLAPPTGARIDLLAGSERRALERGCNAGTAVDCNELGVLHATGRGVEADIAAANLHFRKACDLENAAACANLGLSHENG